MTTPTADRLLTTADALLKQDPWRHNALDLGSIDQQITDHARLLANHVEDLIIRGRCSAASTVACSIVDLLRMKARLTVRVNEIQGAVIS